MDQGRRPHLVSIQRSVTSSGELGGLVYTWHEIATGWARIGYGPAAERRQAAQINAEQAATFEFDWNQTLAGVQTTDRLYVFSTVWNIDGAVVIGGNREVHITAISNRDEEIDS